MSSKQYGYLNFTFKRINQSIQAFLIRFFVEYGYHLIKTYRAEKEKPRQMAGISTCLRSCLVYYVEGADDFGTTELHIEFDFVVFLVAGKIIFISDIQGV